MTTKQSNKTSSYGTPKTKDCANCQFAAAKIYEWTAEKPLPLYADRKTCAAIVTHFRFPVMPKTIATWPLDARKPNRTVVYEVSELLIICE
jgi:hypothetical protein